MNPERLTELAALDAVGALNNQELREFETMLASADAEARVEIATLRDTAALLGGTD